MKAVANPLVPFGILLGAVLSASVAGLIMGWGNAPELAVVSLVAVGALLFVLLPGIGVMSVSVKGLEIKRLEDKVERQENALKSQSETIKEQKDIIDELVKYSLSDDVYNILWRLKNTSDYGYSDTESVKRWCNTLLDHGYIEPIDPKYRLEFGYHLDKQNLVRLAKPTPAGEFLIQLRGKSRFADT